MPEGLRFSTILLILVTGLLAPERDMRAIT